VFSVLLGTLLIVGVVAGAAVIRAFAPPTDKSELRRELLTGLDVSPVSSVEITIPTWAATLGRVGASLANIDPHAKAAIQTVAGGQVGVYELGEHPSRHAVTSMLETADTRLVAEGWTRLVTLLDKDELVVVFVLDSSLSPDDTIKVFAIIMDDRELVMVSASGYAEPLFNLALAEIDGLQL